MLNINTLNIKQIVGDVKITSHKVQLEIYINYIKALGRFRYDDRHEDCLGKIIRRVDV